MIAWTDSAGDNERRPASCLTWYEAFAFCIWDGGRLPTDAEWNYAAMGGSEQRTYPWSDPPTDSALDASRASYYDTGTKSCVGDGESGCAVTDLVFVGSKSVGKGRFGQYDLTGNVWEWVLDWSESYLVPCEDCAGAESGSQRASRGGGFLSSVENLTLTNRSSAPPSDRHFAVGVRCARAP